MLARRKILAFFGGVVAYAAMLPRRLWAAPLAAAAVDTVVQLRIKDGMVQTTFVQDGYASTLHSGDIRSLVALLLQLADRAEERRSFILSLPADTIYVGLKGSFAVTEHGTLRYGTEFIPAHIGRVEREFDKAGKWYRWRYNVAIGARNMVAVDGS